MICGSCGKWCDPNRSFCTNCGSSVFFDARDKRGLAHAPSVSWSRSEARRPDQPITAAGAKAATAASLMPLVRLVIVGLVLWYAARWLLTIPEVRALKDGVQQGQYSDADAQAALDALRARMDTTLGRSPATDTTPQPESPRVSRETPLPRRERPGVASSAQPANDILPPGVYTPGNGVSLPRPVQRVNPSYTPQALRARIEGTVGLRCIVRPDGSVSDVSIVRSLDKEFGLDQQAIAAVQQWRFAPGERLGRPVPVLVQVEVAFTIR